MARFISHSEYDTRNIARLMAEKASGGDVITLKGELGAGKTVFCKGFAEGLGITEEATSPTFTLMKIYNGRLILCHIDAYRLGGGEEAYAAGLCDYIGAPDTVCVIEWAENIVSALPEKVTAVGIEYIDQNTREINIYDK